MDVDGTAGEDSLDVQAVASTRERATFEPEPGNPEGSDADLEASVLDTLTDTVLTGTDSFQTIKFKHEDC